MSDIFAARLADLGLTLPTPAMAVANYVPFVISGSLVFVSGQLPLENGTLSVSGRLGADIGIEDGVRAARLCGLNLLAQAAAAAGGLHNVRRVVRLTAFVASAPDFTDQPKVVNGASMGFLKSADDGLRPYRGLYQQRPSTTSVALTITTSLQPTTQLRPACLAKYIRRSAFSTSSPH